MNWVLEILNELCLSLGCSKFSTYTRNKISYPIMNFDQKYFIYGNNTIKSSYSINKLSYENDVTQLIDIVNNLNIYDILNKYSYYFYRYIVYIFNFFIDSNFVLTNSGVDFTITKKDNVSKKRLLENKKKYVRILKKINEFYYYEPKYDDVKYNDKYQIKINLECYDNKKNKNFKFNTKSKILKKIIKFITDNNIEKSDGKIKTLSSKIIENKNIIDILTIIKTEYSNNFSNGCIYFGDFIHHIDIFNNVIAKNEFDVIKFFDMFAGGFDTENIPHVTYRNKNEVVYAINEFLKNKKKSYSCGYLSSIIHTYIIYITGELAILNSTYE